MEKEEEKKIDFQGKTLAEERDKMILNYQVQGNNNLPRGKVITKKFINELFVFFLLKFSL